MLSQPEPCRPVSHFRIAVTGMGAISALGLDVGCLFRGLLDGRRGMNPIRAFDTQGCRVQIAAEAPEPILPTWARELPARVSSRTARLAIHAVAEAWSDAGLPPLSLHQAGLAFGSTGSGDRALERHQERVLRRPQDARGNLAGLGRYPKRSAADAVAYSLGIGGPRTTVNTACSSGVVAIIQACDWLASGLCDRVVAGGADELTRYTLTGFCSLRAVDPDPCRPFDRARRGMTLGEGAGFLVLERAEDAERRGARVHAWIVGIGQSCDAWHLTAPDPEGRGAARAIQMALATAGIQREQVALVNAHGTGTPHNDQAEAHGILRALGTPAGTPPIHSAKASIGHCLGAAGAIETVITVCSLAANLVPATAGLTDPELPGDYVMAEPRRIAGRYGLSNSFGFGGNNACLILERGESAL